MASYTTGNKFNIPAIVQQLAIAKVRNARGLFQEVLHTAEKGSPAYNAAIHGMEVCDQRENALKAAKTVEEVVLAKSVA